MDSQNPDDIALAAQEGTDPKQLERLAKHGAAWPYLAANPHTPKALLIKFSQHSYLHQALAANPASPPGLLRKLVEQVKALQQDPQSPPKAAQRLVEALSQNPATPASLLLRLPPNPYSLSRSNTPLALLKAAAQNPDLAIWIAANRKTPRKILYQLAQHPSWMVRYEISLNPKSPNKLLKALQTDQLRSVREAARDTLLRLKSLRKKNRG